MPARCLEDEVMLLATKCMASRRDSIIARQFLWYEQGLSSDKVDRGVGWEFFDFDKKDERSRGQKRSPVGDLGNARDLQPPILRVNSRPCFLFFRLLPNSIILFFKNTMYSLEQGLSV